MDTKITTIGIVGGGQLGQMLTLAAKPLGFDVIVVDPAENCPAKQVGARQIRADLYDLAALEKLAEAADFITVEIEHLDANMLEKIEKSGTPVNPAPSTIRLIQDKYQQKVVLSGAGIPMADFRDIGDQAAALEAFAEFDKKLIIKARKGAYDGRGNMVIKKPEYIAEAFERFKGAGLYCERLVDFTKELAVMVCRDVAGTITTYPVVETIHKRNICEEVIAPADIDVAVREKALKLAHDVAKNLEGAGLFGVELFLTTGGEVLLNEVAPRVHNSGHYTLDACRTSQFEQHIRAISGLPLGDTSMLVPAAVMQNILGERNGPTIVKGLDQALAIDGVSVHLYGKSPTKIDRKMGHLTATANSRALARKNAKAARTKIGI